MAVLIVNPSGTLSIGSSVVSGTSGSVLFIDSAGKLAQDNSNFFWDATNHRLGIGTASPTMPLSVSGGYSRTDTSARLAGFFSSNEAAAGNPFGLYAAIQGAAANADRTAILQTTNYGLDSLGNIAIQPNGGRVGIGTAAPTTLFHVKNASSNGQIALIEGTFGSNASIIIDNAGRVAFTAEGFDGGTGGGGAYFTASGYQEAWFNVICKSNTAGQQLLRFGNYQNTFRLDLLNDAGTAIIAAGIFAIQASSLAGSLLVNADGSVIAGAPGQAFLGWKDRVDASIWGTYATGGGTNLWNYGAVRNELSISTQGYFAFESNAYGTYTTANPPPGKVFIHPTTDLTGLIVRGSSGQTMPLLDLQNNGTTSLTTFDSGGKLSVFAGLADAVNVVVGTSTGTKIGTATSQKLGFYNATPVVQQSGDIGTGLVNLGFFSSATKTTNVSDNIALTNQSADITTTNFANAGTAGRYRVSYSLLDTTADLTAGTLTLTIAYTDDAGATTTTTSQVLTGTGRSSGSVYIQLASGNITYAISHTGLFGSAKYALYATCERIN